MSWIKNTLLKLYFFAVKCIRRLQKKFLGKQNRKSTRNMLQSLPQPELSAAEKQDISEYWSQFGIEIKDYCWFQWYYGITGIKDPRFIPQEIYLYTILPYYNRREFIPAYKDKNSFDLRLPAKYFPKTVVRRMSGDFYDKDGVYITSDIKNDRLVDTILAHGQVIVKNAIDSSRGINVKKYDVSSRQDVLSLLESWTATDYIIQEIVHQHPFFAQFNESSVNIIRINSWYHNGEVTLSTPVLRFGMPGYSTDVCFINGEEIVRLVGIKDDGTIRDTVVHMSGKTQRVEEICSDPIRQVPAWDKITAMVKENAGKLYHFHLIGWDVTVTEDNRPIIIEYNITSPSTYSSQMTDGPMWGEHTTQLLSFLKDEENRRKYLL